METQFAQTFGSLRYSTNIFKTLHAFKVKVKCIHKAHLKTTHIDQSAVQLDHNKIENKIENRNKTLH